MKYLSGIFLLVYAATLYAAPATRENLEISRWHPSSNNRIHSPTYNSITRVYFTVSDAWGSTSCRQDSADIDAEDKNLYSALLATFMSSKKVTVEVNDSLPTH